VTESVSDSPALPLTLKRRTHLLNAGYNRTFAGLMALLVLVPLALSGLLLYLAGDAGLAEACRKALQAVIEDPLLVAALVLLPIVLAYLWVVMRHERLLITDQGIEYRSALRGPLSFLGGLRPGWRLGWSDIESVSLSESGSRPQMLQWWRLSLKPARGPARRVAPYVWYSVPDRAGLKLSQVTRFDRGMCRRAVQNSPLYRAIKARMEIERDESPSALAEGFDLWSHKGLTVAVVGFFLVGAYAVGDAFFASPWVYLEAPPPGPFLAAGVVGLVLAQALGRGAPSLERWAVAGLFAVAAAGAVYPALLRVNAATDPDGAIAYRFEQTGSGEFRSVDHPGMPALQFDGEREFWAQTEVGSEREFVLARGSLDFWQLDMRPVQMDMRLFYMGLRRGDDG